MDAAETTTDTNTITETAVVEAPSPEAALLAEGTAVIRRHAIYSAAAGLVPVPLVDVAVITGVQVKMIAELARIHGITFSEHAVKSYVGSLLGAVVPVSPVSGGLISLAKAVPVVGPLLTAAVVPGVASAATWAIGRVFQAHFANGGTLQTVNLADIKARVRSEFESLRRKAGRNKDQDKDQVEPAPGTLDAAA